MNGKKRIVRTLAATFTLAMLTGCATLFGGEKYVVPDQQTASEQARVAQAQLGLSRRTGDPELREEEMRKAIAGFQKVVERFPDDRTFTPPAHLLVADLYAELKEYRRAEATYREVMARYGDIQDVHASALYGLGRTLTDRGMRREGKEAFAQLIDTYGRSDNSAIRTMVRNAKRRYDEIL